MTLDNFIAFVGAAFAVGAFAWVAVVLLGFFMVWLGTKFWQR